MPKVLICSVGTVFEGRENILAVLADEIIQLKPAHVAFVVSRESLPPAQKIAQQAGLADEFITYVVLDTPHDLNEVFARTNETIRQFRALGYSASDISLNYTSGTKVMSSGVVLAAVFNQCSELRYIYEGGASRDRVIITRPEAVSAYRDLLLGSRLIEELRFQSATDLLDRIDSSLLSQSDVAILDALKKLAEAYNAWDTFNPARFVEIMHGLTTQVDLLKKFLVDSGTLGLLAQLASDVARENYSPLIFADMVNNAIRRMLEGKYDAAVARLYRALEMLAQWVLRRYGINTDDVDTRRIPPRFRVNFEALRSMDDGIVRIGMRKAFELLAILDAPLGIRFQAKKELLPLLQKRSKSILAHGTSRVAKDDCEHFLKHSLDLFASEISNFSDTCHALQFPWLRDRYECSVVLERTA
ncbi:MAG: TIGR02710 family CRISPR-associated CARF protein [Candidatus Sumerlaeaceae bacterium]|nr:TIGR02710 family CRISPR-associated CARF protein [Candidatus Sumerlaeaceae bacterium]